MKLSDITLPGCYVDASAQSADYLNTRIIQFAQSYGCEVDCPEWPYWLDRDNHSAQSDYSEILTENADNAVDWLNENTHLKDHAWTVDDNSLFLCGPDSRRVGTVQSGISTYSPTFHIVKVRWDDEKPEDELNGVNCSNLTPVASLHLEPA